VCVPTVPNYDPVYVPGIGNVDTTHVDTNTIGNGHTYQNVGHRQTESPLVKPKPSPSVFGQLKSKTVKVFSFFKKQPSDSADTLSVPVKHRDREISGGSYDHLRPNSGGMIEYKPPQNDQGHVYSRAKAISDAAIEDESNSPNYTNSQALNSDVEVVPVNGKPDNDKDANAVNVGDSYIEFTFDEVDESKLVKTKPKENSDHVRPEPPKRPPPSPKLDTSKLKSSLPTTPIIDRKLPNTLSPDAITPTNQPSYDYAAGPDSARASPIPRPSTDAADNTSEHSYKILEPDQPMYDYADVGEEEEIPEDGQYGSIYEDVDTKCDKKETIKKDYKVVAKSIEPSEYLEPVESKMRTVSPGDYVNTPRDKNVEVGQRVLPDTKSQSKQISPSKHIDKKLKSNENIAKCNSVVKSDNINLKEYGQAGEVKGVLKMKAMFEKTESSDSDSSRQNSPRSGNVKEKGLRLGHLLKQTQGHTKGDSEA